VIEIGFGLIEKCADDGKEHKSKVILYDMHIFGVLKQQTT
jgi:hypothetical protein